jgi:uncharacterized protein YjaZ
MQFHVVDTEVAYRHLLAAPDADARKAIFREELIAPFQGLVQIFGGDGLAVFKGWGMAPEQFTEPARVRMADAIEALAVHHAWARAAKALQDGRAAFVAYEERIPLQTVVFGLFVADLSASPWARGYTGFGGFPGWIMTVYGEPDGYNLARVEAATVHELHHNILGAVAPYNMMSVTVGQYMVLEGLAESFAAELYGARLVGPWVSEFDESSLEETRRIIGGVLQVSGFDRVRSYIFGDAIGASAGRATVGVPLHAGYAIGYRVVQAYLETTGKSVIDATFVPADEIIAESGFFT